MVLKRGRKRDTNIAILQTALKEVATLTPHRMDRNEDLYQPERHSAKGLKSVEPIINNKKKGIKKDAVINTKMLLT